MIKRLVFFLVAIFGIVIAIYGVKLFFLTPFSINHLLSRHIIIEALESPEYLTSLGVLEQYGMRSHNGKFSNDSLEKDQKDLKKIKRLYKMINSYDNDNLNKRDLSTKKIALFQLENEIKERIKYPYHSYPLRQMNGAHTQIIEFMTDIHPIKDEKDGEYYISRLNKIPVSFNQILEKMELRKELKIFPPTFMVKRVIEQINNVLEIPTEEHPLALILETKLRNLNLEEGIVVDFKERAMLAMENNVFPAYRRLLDHMNTILPLANQHHGVWSLPDGDNFYALRLRRLTTSNFTPEEVHKIGLSEVDRITKEIIKILESQGYSKLESVGKTLIELNMDKRFLYEDNKKSREDIIQTYFDIIKEANKNMGEYFSRLPKAPVIVKPVPSYSEKNAAGGYYRSPTLDGSRPGIFYANLYDIKATPKFSMKTLAFHEAIPGHHFQIALSQENNQLNLFRKFGVNATAYTEGWALYAEKLAVEAGLSDDPYDRIGFFQSELFRAVRLVVDTGIHYKRWTREEAIEYMINITGKAESSVIAEIERYISWPGQACSYKIGMLSILKLRKKAKEILKNNFDIKEFHNFILDNGELPLIILESNFEEWINRESLKFTSSLN